MDVNDYKKILIIGAEVKPIPSVKGGAVEQLDEQILIKNEIDKFANISIISPYDSDALIESKNYKNTSFLFINGLQGIKASIYKYIDLFSRKFFKRSTGILYIHKVCKLLKKQNYDIVIVENRPLFGIHIRKVYKGKLYLHLHNDYINKKTAQLTEIKKTYDKIIVVSLYLKNRINETEYTNVEVVYNGIDLNKFACKNEGDKEIKTILYVGRIVKEKGILELLTAFSAIKNDKIELLLIGNYDKNAYHNRKFIREFKNLIKKDQRIKHIGYIENNKLIKYYSKAYIGVVSTIIEEALSLTAIEMIASNLPVIATNSGGLTEVIDNTVGVIINKDKLIENLENAIQILLDDTVYRQSLSNNCKNKIDTFSLDKYTSDIVNSILN